MSLKQTKSGFSLIEVVITIAIVGLMILVYQGIVSNVILTRTAQNKDIALKIASYKIEELRATGYGSLPASGSFSDSLLNSIPSGTATIAVTTYSQKVKQVAVTVSWTEPNSSQISVVLTTLIADSGGL